MKGKRVLVLGLAKSGKAVAKLLAEKGAQVIVNELKQEDQLSGIEDLKAQGISVICGGHPLSLLDQPIDFIVKNPGIPYHLPLLQEAVKRKIPILTEVEIGYWYTKAPIIGVTGSNGKTTTTTLIGQMLVESGLKAQTAGNIGNVFCQVAPEASRDEWLVTELSSFQLLGTCQFHPRIGVLLNVYNAHLDYHQTKEAYMEAKAKLFANQTEDDVAILNADQEATRTLGKRLKGEVLWFSRTGKVDRGAYLHGDAIVYRQSWGEEVVLSRREIRLPGVHNLENGMAALLAALQAGASLEAVRTVLRQFPGVAHRLQFVVERDGVAYYNDSKATNALATRKAIESFEGKVILIAGGLDRGEDFKELEAVFRSHLKGLVVYGETADRLAKVGEKAGVKAIFHVDTITDAVKVAHKLAVRGDTVLLSPACASWDQFSSFEERGDMFIRSVHMLD